MASVYTEEQLVFLYANCKGITTMELAEKFNAHFGTDKSRDKIKAFLSNHHLKNGVDCRFKKGHVPLNKGQKGYCHPCSVPTQFKKGHVPANHKPIGSERIDSKQCYLLVKVAEPNVWRPKHVVVWEQANGPIPKGHKLLFIDQNRQNISLKNLMCVTPGEMAVLNKNRMLIGNYECNMSSLLLAKLLMRISRRKQKK